MNADLVKGAGLMARVEERGDAIALLPLCDQLADLDDLAGTAGAAHDRNGLVVRELILHFGLASR
jgi:hypothetical protein